MDTSNSGPGRRSGIESLGSNRQQYVQSRPSPTQQTSTKMPYPWNLTRFYDMDEAPWVPRGIVPNIPPDTQPGQHLSGPVTFQATAPSFQNYRSRPLPSDCDTSHEDSGYGGSGAPYSIDNASVYEDDQNPEAQSATQLFADFHLEVPNNQLQSWQPSRATPSVVTAPTSGEHKYHCSICDTWLRTKSELNKHCLRHSKPFRCEAPRCNRREGFSTRNDLDRHKRSVHSDLSISGPRYVCRLSQCGNRENPKLWPRADNFRSHLRRVHQKEYSAEDDLSEYIYHQTPMGLEGVGGSALSYMDTNQSANVQKPSGHSYPQSFLVNQAMDTKSRHGIPQLQDDLDSMLQNSTSAPSEKGLPGPAPAQEGDDSFMQPDTLHANGQVPLHSGRSFGIQMFPHSSDARRYPQPNQDSISRADQLSVGDTDDNGTLDDVTGPSDLVDDNGSTSGSDASQPQRPGLIQSKPRQLDVKMADVEREQPKPASRSSSDTIAVNLLGLHKDTGMVLEYLKTLPKELLKSALNSDTDSTKETGPPQELASQKAQHPCTECKKKFSRPCELKKHLKRHEKPYGCTFYDCSKAFGSKNDWKRHESSQHWQLETWKCEDKKTDKVQSCGKVCHRRESFKHHLQKEHEVKDAKQIEEKLDRCRIGRHCDTRFWCGFCVKIIEITDAGVNAWTKRCDHVDDHFSGRDGKTKRHINEWKHLENEDQGREESQREVSTQSSSEESSSIPESGRHSPLKRKLSADAELVSHKRQRQEIVGYMWTCCRCNADTNLKTSSMCINCSHQKCKDNCSIIQVMNRAEDD